MGWVENIRNKPKEQRIRLIWICVIVAAVLLIVLWGVTWKYKKSAPKETTIFKVIDKGVKDAAEQFTPIKK